jgi:hypothetical protein
MPSSSPQSGFFPNTPSEVKHDKNEDKKAPARQASVDSFFRLKVCAPEDGEDDDGAASLGLGE